MLSIMVDVLSSTSRVSLGGKGLRTSALLHKTGMLIINKKFWEELILLLSLRKSFICST
jgi:hypothetical protein